MNHAPAESLSSKLAYLPAEQAGFIDTLVACGSYAFLDLSKMIAD